MRDFTADSIVADAAVLRAFVIACMEDNAFTFEQALLLLDRAGGFIHAYHQMADHQQTLADFAVRSDATAAVRRSVQLIEEHDHDGEEK